MQAPNDRTSTHFFAFLHSESSFLMCFMKASLDSHSCGDVGEDR